MHEDVEYWTCGRQLERLEARIERLEAVLQTLLSFATADLREDCDCPLCRSIRAAQELLAEKVHG